VPAWQDGFAQRNGGVPFELHKVRLGRGLGPQQHDMVVGRYRLPDGFRPLLAAVNALLIAPHGDVVGLQSALELFCGM
jgi:hypothetical protein